VEQVVKAIACNHSTRQGNRERRLRGNKKVEGGKMSEPWIRKNIGQVIIAFILLAFLLKPISCPACPDVDCGNCGSLKCPETNLSALVSAVKSLSSKLPADVNCSAVAKPVIQIDRSYFQANHAPVEYYFQGNDVCVRNVFLKDVHGFSMQPFAWTGNLLLFKKYNDATDRGLLKEGMVIEYENAGGSGTTTHAIKGIYPESNRVVVQGYNVSSGESISFDRIKAILVGVVLK